MGDGYMQPYQSLNSTAKLIRLPKNDKINRSFGRTLWSKVLSTSSMSKHNSKLRSDSPSSTSHRSQDLNSTVTLRNDSLSSCSPAPSTRSSISTLRTSQSSVNAPLPRPRMSFSKRSVSESESANSINNSVLNFSKVDKSSGSTKTIITLHMSNKTRSTPNLERFDHSYQCMNEIDQNKRISPESQTAGTRKNKNPAITNTLTASNRSKSLSELRNHNFSQCQDSVSNVELNSLQVFRQPKYKGRCKAEKKIKQLEHLDQNKNCNELVNQLSAGIQPNIYANQQQLNIVDFINKEGFITSSKIPVVNNKLLKSERPTVPEKTNSRKVLRYEKDHVYAEHTTKSELLASPERTNTRNVLRCEKDHVYAEHTTKSKLLSSPERTNTRNVLQCEKDHIHAEHTTKSILLSSPERTNTRNVLRCEKDHIHAEHTTKPERLAIPERKNNRKEHIYAEIEQELNSEAESLVQTPILRKRVTFSTVHEPIQEFDPFSLHKKILPARFVGIVQVTLPLRSKRDEERRRVAYLCYHALVTRAQDNSLTFMGKVDTSRCGESAYVVIEDSSFEILDSEGLVITKHGFSDISVVTHIKDDSFVLVYVGRCKFSGRVGVAVRFNKTKHLSLFVNCFRRNSRRPSFSGRGDVPGVSTGKKSQRFVTETL